jgi:hypothetical protein
LSSSRAANVLGITGFSSVEEPGTAFGKFIISLSALLFDRLGDPPAHHRRRTVMGQPRFTILALY